MNVLVTDESDVYCYIPKSQTYLSKNGPRSWRWFSVQNQGSLGTAPEPRQRTLDTVYYHLLSVPGSIEYFTSAGKFRRKIPQAEVYEKPSSWAQRGIDYIWLFCTLSFTAAVFSADLTFLRRTAIVSLLVKQLILICPPSDE